MLRILHIRVLIWIFPGSFGAVVSRHMRDATTCRGVETESSFVPIRHRGAIQQRLLSLVGASALMLMACDAVPPGVPLQISGSGSAASARDRQASIPRRAPGDSALQVTFAPGTTSRLLEGTLDAGREAEFVVSAEGGSVLMASVLGASAAIEASVYRIDTGEEIPDSAPDHSFWIARVPETAGYLIVLHGASVPTDYTLTVGIPSDSLLDMLQFSPELARVDARGNNSTPRSGPAAKVSTMSRLQCHSCIEGTFHDGHLHSAGRNDFRVGDCDGRTCPACSTTSG